MRGAALCSVASCRSSFPLPRLPFTLPVIILLTFFGSNLPKKEKAKDHESIALRRADVQSGDGGKVCALQQI